MAAYVLSFMLFIHVKCTYNSAPEAVPEAVGGETSDTTQAYEISGPS